MKIAIACADLDAERIDGTRVYIHEVLGRLGELGASDEFLLYHRGQFNPELTPPVRDNYNLRKLRSPFPTWTQTRFALEMWRVRPDVLWMPMHALPFVLPAGLRTVVTIHDLAFKLFPEHFPTRDRIAQNILTDHAVACADKLIAVSEATKRDIVQLYPQVNSDKIKVVSHGVNIERFAQKYVPTQIAQVLDTYNLQSGQYILYVGALQPRKNLVRLIEAFAQIAQKFPSLKLVLAGGVGWLADDILTAAKSSPVSNRIILTGRLPFEKIAILMQNAQMLTFVSLYEGFGLPILEAFAAGVPVVTADNSSLPEVAGEAAEYCNAEDTNSIANAISRVATDDNLRKSMIARGSEQLTQFSWDKCATQTLEVLTNN